ncbi:hypothetical protein EBI00_01855 [Marinomonas hwangdonensis]|uniref:Uncharacterized protein n=1 Tax=Marinomonas hwangdonensis TaxID=1053647 RepID=A0A3M8Q9X9_9GAMM|nr:hypothetical protein EBI00_01855 [Marinomonas hwangdonensis]
MTRIFRADKRAFYYLSKIFFKNIFIFYIFFYVFVLSVFFGVFSFILFSFLHFIDLIIIFHTCNLTII